MQCVQPIKVLVLVVVDASGRFGVESDHIEFNDRRSRRSVHHPNDGRAHRRRRHSSALLHLHHDHIGMWIIPDEVKL